MASRSVRSCRRVQATTSAFKLWLRYAKPVRGTLEIDAGAARALASGGGSLLPVGVIAVHGSVQRRRRRRDRRPMHGREIARGLTAMDARELRRVAGLRSDAATGRRAAR